MIIVKLWGGMCNQMFQYAFGYALAKKYGEELAFDIDFFKNQPSQVGKREVISTNDFALTRLKFAKRPGIVKIVENRYLNHLLRYNTGCEFTSRKVHFFLEKHFKHYENVPYKAHLINYYDGYWQSSLYSDFCHEELIREFTPTKSVVEKVSVWKESLSRSNLVAVHVRRGDYLNKINTKTIEDVVSGPAYYMRAVEYMKKHIEKPTFCFISDDIEWCKNQFGDRIENAVFVENVGKDAAIIDLFTMAACNHEIMSPSTFSWFGNWLRDSNKESIIVCPKVYEPSRKVVMSHWVEL